MLKNHIKNAFRHLWRNKLFTALNILGLAIGISACWVIYRIIDYEFSYDVQLTKSQRIYKVISAFSREGKESRMGGVSAPLHQGIAEEITGMEHVVPVFGQWVNSVEIERKNQEVFIKEDPDQIAATTPSYFAMLPYRWIAGDKRTALDAPESVVLTQSRASLYFPNIHPEDILRQTITYYGRDTVTRTVTGIVADYYTPSEFTTQEFFALPKTAYESYMWTNTNGSDRLYLQLADGVNARAKLREINELDARHWSAFEEERKSQGNTNVPKRGRSYELLPIRDAHFATHVADYGVSKTSKPVLYGLIGIGVFLLVLACINYVNMSVAQIPQRGKEIGVRKTLGGGVWQLIGLFLSETLITAVVASIFAFAFGRLAFWGLADIIPVGVTPTDGIGLLIGFMLGLVVLITLFAGLYPSWLITRVKTVDVFKNFFSTATPARRFSLQQVLIVFQFTIALVFIISAIIVGTQLRHTLRADMGFNKDAVVLVNVPWKYLSDPRYQDKQFTLLNELRQLPGIEKVALGSAPLSSGYSSSPFGYAPDGKNPVEITGYKKFIDTAFLDLYQMDLLAGRNIRASDTIAEFIINETAASAFGFKTPDEAIGKFIGQRGNAKQAIAGVVKDFHTQDFYTPITPVILATEKPSLTTFNIKMDSYDPARWQATLKAIGEEWAAFYPAETFQYRFYDETLEAMYKQERQIGRLINLATIITILISCLGLFGLATLTAFQRTKEIGIRKVLGATVTSVLGLLSKDFVKLVLIAIVIASPIAWWAMNKWLADFAYRIDIQWWMFALAGSVAVVIAMLTVGWQAIRAAVANPVESLRDE
ncbi:ABC transporter permease [Parapedobacter indicus]|uniref:ABC-type antimicrobial peptide transport system, permease component n=1 Tax=Parapedobacter indicus TaxID=1477437 RepID=A0A1I3HED9_9SPHI|nr:FtsX-like permease family protein [Parapedobacter indicus]PPL02999.1 ABC-type antimicrobial peptide transport system permease subunit [Parapedobacter indicus]SFI33950.1 ABC-type antimicrobial peptide transport system, permease component [Parapedobacter indicus]